MYKTYLPYITFEKTIQVRSLNTEDAKKLVQLEHENEELKAKMGEMEKKASKNEELEAKVQTLDSIVGVLAEKLGIQVSVGKFPETKIRTEAEVQELREKGVVRKKDISPEKLKELMGEEAYSRFLQEANKAGQGQASG